MRCRTCSRPLAVRSSLTALLAALSLTGCSLRQANRVGVVLSAATLACDWSGTRSAASDGWVRFREGGPVASRVMGTAPEPHAVDAYFVLTGLVVLGGTRLLPERWRPLAYVVTVTVEATVAHRNVPWTGPCGVR